MDWLKIGSALLLVMMLIYLLPGARRMLAESRSASPDEWMSALIPLLAVAGFVFLLIQMV